MTGLWGESGRPPPLACCGRARLLEPSGATGGGLRGREGVDDERDRVDELLSGWTKPRPVGERTLGRGWRDEGGRVSGRRRERERGRGARARTHLARRGSSSRDVERVLAQVDEGRVEAVHLALEAVDALVCGRRDELGVRVDAAERVRRCSEGDAPRSDKRPRIWYAGSGPAPSRSSAASEGERESQRGQEWEEDEEVRTDTAGRSGRPRWGCPEQP